MPDWIIFLNPFISILLGMVIGWFTRAYYDVRKTRKDVESMKEDVTEIKDDVSDIKDEIIGEEEEDTATPVTVHTETNVVTNGRKWYLPTTFTDFAQIVLIVAVILSLLGYYLTFQQRIQDQERTNSRVQCENHLSGLTLEALQQRNIFTDETTKKQVQLLDQQVMTLRLIGDPASTPEIFADSVKKYANLSEELSTIFQQTQQRREKYPFPTEEDYNACSHLPVD